MLHGNPGIVMIFRYGSILKKIQVQNVLIIGREPEPLQSDSKVQQGLM